MRRRKLLAALAGLAVVVVAGAFAAWARPDRITRDNCASIREGMSRAEVLAILGPPGDYRTIQTVEPDPLSVRSVIATPADYAKAAYERENVFVFRTGSETFEQWMWLGDEGDIFAWYRGEGVSSHGMVASNRVEQTPLDNLLWRAKRQWHRWFP